MVFVADAFNENLIFAHIHRKTIFNRQIKAVWLIDITDFIYISIIGLRKAWSNCLSPNEKIFNSKYSGGRAVSE